MRIRSIVLIAVLCVASFGYGVGFWAKKLPPYDQIREVVRTFKPKPLPPLADFTLNKPAIIQTLDDLKLDVETNRADLISRVIFPIDHVTIEPVIEGGDVVGINSQIYGQKTATLFARSENPKSCLRIYVQGHGGNPLDFGYHTSIRDQSTANGCDFLSMSMVGKGLNNGPTEFPSGRYEGQTTRMNWREANRHGSYLTYHDNELPNYDYMALFLSPHYYTIRSILGDYDHVSVMGISGGGWYSVWLAALIPEIDYSIIYAGSLPNVYRTSEAFFADYEEVTSPVYDTYDYWKLYQLGSVRAPEFGARKQYFVFNDKDDCCFMDPAASHFANLVDEIYGGSVEVFIDESTTHTMNVDMIKKVWALQSGN